MAEYYVIKNKETGLYFRGKGVNRWGKYFNQASIYRIKGTAEHSIKEIAWHGEEAEIVSIQIAESTIDAVPVIRCRNCKYYNLQALACLRPNFNGWIGMNGFCSYGERKE